MRASISRGLHLSRQVGRLSPRPPAGGLNDYFKVGRGVYTYGWQLPVEKGDAAPAGPHGQWTQATHPVAAEAAGVKLIATRRVDYETSNCYQDTFRRYGCFPCLASYTADPRVTPGKSALGRTG